MVFVSRSKMTCLQFLDRKYLGFRSGHRYGLDIRVGIEIGFRSGHRYRLDIKAGIEIGLISVMGSN